MPITVPVDSDSWPRLPLEITGRRLSGAGMSVGFSPGDPTSVLTAYLRLIRRIRNQKKAPAIALRREDILTLARYLDIDGAAVVERLSTLMNVTAAQRNTMVMLFASGAIVIGLAAGGHATADAVTNSTDAGRTSPVAGIDRGAAVAGLSTATRLQVPVHSSVDGCRSRADAEQIRLQPGSVATLLPGVLQTCEGEDLRWMVYADFVTT